VSGARTLDGWLEYISNLHPVTIELTLERVAQVWRQLRPDAVPGSMGVPVIMVGGTNGKGSTCAMLEAILDRAGYRVGCYTSPHLLRYNERVRISRQDATDADLCRAFEAVEAARGDIGLTYFEFGTLAAFWLMMDARVDVAVLEVGLGGRLDAVNILDADVAVVTSIGLDHMEYLGDTREKIGFEKAGIYRPGRAAICADADAPSTLVAHAQAIGARLLRAGIDYDFTDQDGSQWRYRRFAAQGADGSGTAPAAAVAVVSKARYGLPFPALRGAAFIEPAVLDACAERALAFLQATAIRDGDFVNWWPSVPRHTSNHKPPFLQDCHGAPGLLSRLAAWPRSVPHTEVWDELLHQAGELSWHAGPINKGVAFCHGSAGSAHAFLKLFERTGDQRWLDAEPALRAHYDAWAAVRPDGGAA
jgi:hypothetical protein